MSLLSVPLYIDSVSPACFIFWSIGYYLNMAEHNAIMSSVREQWKRFHTEWSTVVLFPLHLKACLHGDHLGNLSKSMTLLCKSQSIKLPYGCSYSEVKSLYFALAPLRRIKLQQIKATVVLNECPHGVLVHFSSCALVLKHQLINLRSLVLVLTSAQRTSRGDSKSSSELVFFASLFI